MLLRNKFKIWSFFFFKLIIGGGENINKKLLMLSLMVVLAVICVGSVSASDYDNLTSDSQDMLATTDSIDVSQENGENDVLEVSDDDEVLSDYNYDYYGFTSFIFLILNCCE